MYRYVATSLPRCCACAGMRSSREPRDLTFLSLWAMMAARASLPEPEPEPEPPAGLSLSSGFGDSAGLWSAAAGLQKTQLQDHARIPTCIRQNGRLCVVHMIHYGAIGETPLDLPQGVITGISHQLCGKQNELPA